MLRNEGVVSDRDGAIIDGLTINADFLLNGVLLGGSDLVTDPFGLGNLFEAANSVGQLFSNLPHYVDHLRVAFIVKDIFIELFVLFHLEILHLGEL